MASEGVAPASVAPHPPQTFLQSSAQKLSHRLLQQAESAAQTQASHLHPGHPGPSLAWQPVQMPQS